MPYTPFYDAFPKIAEAETRCLISFADPLLPADTYALTELYCNEVNCDCRRVFLQIASKARKDYVAVIAYGWATTEYYKKWLHNDNPEFLKDLKGPVLNDPSPQSDIADVLLERIKEVLKDKEYVERLKRHYRMFKSAISKQTESKMATDYHANRRPGRNQPCPCGSGKKYKYCCGE